MFKASLLHGDGEETVSDGSHYVGLFKNGKKHGKGTYKWADKS